MNSPCPFSTLLYLVFNSSHSLFTHKTRKFHENVYSMLCLLSIAAPQKTPQNLVAENSNRLSAHMWQFGLVLPSRLPSEGCLGASFLQVHRSLAWKRSGMARGEGGHPTSVSLGLSASRGLSWASLYGGHGAARAKE